MRLLIMAPVAIVPEAFGPALSPTGEGPPTHRWQAGTFTSEEARRAIAPFRAVPSPVLWERWLPSQRAAWVHGIREALWLDARVWLAVGEGDPNAELKGRGLRRVR